MGHADRSPFRCITPECVDSISKYGENYHGVCPLAAFGEVLPPAFFPEAVAKCQRCGGYTDGKGNWKHVCAKCGKEVAPGELRGFFVPHRCTECDAKVVAADKAAGRVCSRCRQVLSYCCC